jgi:hypothetical protein
MPPADHRTSLSVSENGRRELIEYLSEVSRGVRQNDPVRWQENGILPGTANINSLDDIYVMRHRIADMSSTSTIYIRDMRAIIISPFAGYRIATLLRYSTPVRLGEAWEYLEWLKLEFESAPHNWKVKTIHDDM